MSRLYFHADEVLAMAEDIEQNGAAFYRKASEMAALSELRELLQELAAMEDEHQRIFAGMRRALGGGQQVEPSEHEDAALYVRAWADGHVFDVKRDPSSTLTGGETGEEVLRMALSMEKDSIAFYTGIREALSETSGRGRIEEIIKEEMGHVVELSHKLSGLRGS